MHAVLISTQPWLLSWQVQHLGLWSALTPQLSCPACADLFPSMHACYAQALAESGRVTGSLTASFAARQDTCIASVQTWACKMMHAPQPCIFDNRSKAMAKVAYQHVGGPCIAYILQFVTLSLHRLKLQGKHTRVGASTMQC